MYEFSRDIYQALRPYVAGTPEDLPRRRRILLHACEGAVRLVAAHPDSPGHAARHLFREVRTLLHPAHQLEALTLIEVRLELARAALADGGTDNAMGLCAATNRKGKPCRREAMKGSRYCPSHRALEADVAPPGLQVEPA
ncbi:MAG TPA: hypothetical protein VNT51_08045 [Miltoncostaeaceae bacterium]|nr:hypothetical protein [Miltoncostaeaceae bacterium]